MSSGIASRIGSGEIGVEQVNLLVDGHVHVHPQHDPAALVEGAFRSLSLHGPGLPTLFFTETRRASVFDTWRKGSPGFPVRQTNEEESIIVDDRLLVIAGTQIVTAQKIEVLSIASRARIEDGLGLDETLDRVQAGGGIAVLPWGLGKWLGARAKHVSRVTTERPVLLGDNAGRPFFWPAPSAFGRRPTLPGTDPFAESGEERFVGRYGFRLDCELDLQRPAGSIREALGRLTVSPEPFGARIPFPHSITRQLRCFLPRGKGSNCSAKGDEPLHSS